MGTKVHNEITLKVNGELKELCNMIEEKGFKIVDKFILKDTYFIPRTINEYELSIRDVLKKALLVRDIVDEMDGTVVKKITFKMKEFDQEGNILSQEAVSCDVGNIEDAKKLLEAIGYKQIMQIQENDVVYGKDGLEIVVKDVQNSDKLIELETSDDNRFDTIDKLVEELNKLDLPIDTTNYFVKKAEIELKKVLQREKVCGCVIIQDGKVVLVKQTQGHWGFPKGHIEKGETEEQTAIREVKEETNLDVEIVGNKRYSMQYVNDKGIEKEAVFFIAKQIGGNIQKQESEILEVQWFDFKEAVDVLIYDDIKEMLIHVLKDNGLYDG